MTSNNIQSFIKTIATTTIINSIIAILVNLCGVSSALTVEPLQQSIEVGNKAIFTCTVGKAEVVTIVWAYRKDATTAVVTTNTTSTTNTPQTHRITTINGTLTIGNVTEDDQRKYYCGAISMTTSPDNKNKEEWGEVNLVVYVMPDYEVELLTIGLVCLFFLLALVVLFAMAWRKEKKRKMLHKEGKEVVELKVNEEGQKKVVGVQL